MRRGFYYVENFRRKGGLVLDGYFVCYAFYYIGMFVKRIIMVLMTKFEMHII